MEVDISRHAIRQYRARVIRCCERIRSDDLLRGIIRNQVLNNPWRLAGGQTFAIDCGPLILKTNGWDYKIACVTHTFIVEQRTVVTVLGYGMRPNRRLSRRKQHAAKMAAIREGRRIVSEQLAARALSRI
jgi:hypothetical protein